MFRPLGYRPRGFGHGHWFMRTVALILFLLVAGTAGRAMAWESAKSILPLIVVLLAFGAVKVGGR